ncbi:transcription antitermination factor NusB [Paramicrobacterium chengjingii]|uniref:Transcription antitermination protein NusB n=1 Tax=Paramicrobacterium chengjingii TaxID=2769067 RepID=A0ABX6YMR3_9MICO|nr:transcription antitermination factor NusB [Microbacterium chengjingii]QPZ39995.1 transcription antitermination factor NusB [Microbacterium chengjingii]
MSARSKARKRAIDILYSADVRQQDLVEALGAEAKRASSEPTREASWLYARDIIDGILESRAEIDEQIETYSQGWTLARMPAVDRAILRIGVWEILHNDEVPTGVAINEAVELAKTLSTDESAGFVNGLLGKIAEAAGAF